MEGYVPDLLPFLSPPRYLLYWRSRFLEQPVTEFCSVIKTNSTGPVGAFADRPMRVFPAAAADTRVMMSSQTLCFVSTEKQENYFLLCDVLPEDLVLREMLQKKRLVRK